jgi:hypothetical protein
VTVISISQETGNMIFWKRADILLRGYHNLIQDPFNLKNWRLRDNNLRGGF